MAALGSVLGSDASKSAWFTEGELVAEFKPPAPVAAELSFRDPSAQQTKIDAFQREAVYKKIKHLSGGGGHVPK